MENRKRPASAAVTFCSPMAPRRIQGPERNSLCREEQIQQSGSVPSQGFMQRQCLSSRWRPPSGRLQLNDSRRHGWMLRSRRVHDTDGNIASRAIDRDGAIRSRRCENVGPFAPHPRAQPDHPAGITATLRAASRIRQSGLQIVAARLQYLSKGSTKERPVQEETS
jgi:hypothetical protein